MKKSLWLLLLLPVIVLIFFMVNVTSIGNETSTVPVMAGAESGKITLVIDAGHGGEDGGAVAKDGMVESTINLEISKKVQALCGLFGLESEMTRDSKKIDYPESAHTTHEKKVADQKARISKINSVDKAVLLSIHQNMYTSSSPSGAQALYAKTSGSKEFAENIQNNLLTFIDPDNRRTAVKISNDIYLMKSVSCPAVLVECGFMSNPQDLTVLEDGSSQLKIAAVLMASYMQSIPLLEEVYGKG